MGAGARRRGAGCERVVGHDENLARNAKGPGRGPWYPDRVRKPDIEDAILPPSDKMEKREFIVLSFGLSDG